MLTLIYHKAITQFLRMEVRRGCCHAMRDNYEEALAALNRLQTNAEALRRAQLQSNAASTTSTKAATPSTTQSRSTSVDKMQGFLSRSHIDLDRLKSVIHISGTKGKGSTCALTEQLLRQHGFKTGFYSSPHLVHVTERIRIDGEPLKKTRFARLFWEVLTHLRQTNDPCSMPIYFEMLTLMAFKCFIEEDVDVAIVEVGIGGQYDSTNILRRVVVAGITSLGLDHTSLLGSTIEDIAWQKAGIMKPGCMVYTVSQPASALEVLQKRSQEADCCLEVVDESQFEEYLHNNTIPREVYRKNTSLALQLATTWLSLQGTSLERERTMKALNYFCWPGRFQVVRQGSGNVFLEGAHTIESITFCAQWFCQQVAALEGDIARVLIFNSTGSRDVNRHLQTLHQCGFKRVYFVPNISSTRSSKADNVNNNFPVNEQLIKCVDHKRIWCELFPHHANRASVMPSVEDALLHVQHLSASPHATLVTGSLHLVGSALEVLQSMSDALNNCAATN